VNSEQKRNLQRQPVSGAAHRSFSCADATFATQLINNMAGIGQYQLVIPHLGEKAALSCPVQVLREVRAGTGCS
jgi:hypothetical protein